jgi:ABC-2 type transport system permease protein
VLRFFSGWVAPVILDAIASLSLYTHFYSISRGVIDLRDVVFFALLISAMLYANTIVLSLTKTD